MTGGPDRRNGAENPDWRGRQGGPGQPAPPELEPDFADEHTSPTFADQMRGGPEGMREPESPRGLAGMNGGHRLHHRLQHWLRRRWRRRRPRRG
jgi:hypothetical protein